MKNRFKKVLMLFCEVFQTYIAIVSLVSHLRVSERDILGHVIVASENAAFLIANNANKQMQT